MPIGILPHRCVCRVEPSDCSELVTHAKLLEASARDRPGFEGLIALPIEELNSKGDSIGHSVEPDDKALSLGANAVD